MSAPARPTGGDVQVRFVEAPGAGPRRLVVLGALVRAVPRGPVAALAGSAVAGVGVVSALWSAPAESLALQAATIPLAGVAVTLLQEPALDALPTTLARRRVLLLGAALVPLAALWLALLALTATAWVDARVLTLQLAAVTSLALGLAARGGDPVAVVAGVALAFAAARGLLGPPLLRTDVSAGWWLAATAAGLLALAAFSRDRL
ncbi:hypothetical protein [Solirubrobacter soli]|uniref:hypothetical protein n=1 Tax=Solirubrobacter soli TaxID=363832 RepID=UPI0004832417|nr:hypothetical protein [Solirubrobacter soli]